MVFAFKLNCKLTSDWATDWPSQETSHSEMANWCKLKCKADDMQWYPEASRTMPASQSRGRAAIHCACAGKCACAKYICLRLLASYLTAQHRTRRTISVRIQNRETLGSATWKGKEVQKVMPNKSWTIRGATRVVFKAVFQPITCFKKYLWYFHKVTEL